MTCVGGYNAGLYDMWDTANQLQIKFVTLWNVCNAKYLYIEYICIW